ncbi:methyltransferase type 11 [Neoconidiobolus thromboides FSU 785]|nr:methyltransferase type 11 [Neoconidiobolus thromboides FSU 785]
MKSESKDLFSNHSKIYAQNRPSHPKELFDYLTKNITKRELAWDVATGNGQAASLLADYFDNVIATDLSEKQISEAIKKPNIRYEVEPSEAIDSNLIAPNSVDLITVAVGIHWFPFDKFYERVNKVLKKGGIIAAWVYWHPEVNKEVNQIHVQIEKDYFEKYDPIEVEHCKKGYSTIPWPFKTPEWHTKDSDGVNKQFSSVKHLNLDQYCDYLRTRSSAQLYKEDTEKDALTENYEQLLKAWGEPEEVKKVVWNMKLLVGVKE